MRVKETQPPASEGPASRAVALDKPLFQTHPLCTSVPPLRKMSIERHESTYCKSRLSVCYGSSKPSPAEPYIARQHNASI